MTQEMEMRTSEESAGIGVDSPDMIGIQIDRSKGTMQPAYKSKTKIAWYVKLKNQIKAQIYSWKHREDRMSEEDALKEKLKELHVILECVDEMLRQEHITRQDRKHFWDRFFRLGEFRQEFLEDLAKHGDVKPIVAKYVESEFRKSRS